MTNVARFPTERTDDTLTCGVCGSVWFSTQGITVASDGRPTGYVWPLRCHECGWEHQP